MVFGQSLLYFLMHRAFQFVFYFTEKAIDGLLLFIKT